MNSYNLGKIDSTTDIRGASRYGFNIIGVQGRPLVGFSFDTQDEAEAAHKAMRDIVATAKLIRPPRADRHLVERDRRNRHRTAKDSHPVSPSCGAIAWQERDSKLTSPRHHAAELSANLGLDRRIR